MITAKQIRAGRAILDWSQQDLADEAELSKPAIVDIEKDGHQARAETMGKITNALEGAGLEFMSGGVRERRDILTVFEGDDCYLRLIDEAYRVLKPIKGEILYYAADESRTPEFIQNRNLQMIKDGITRKLLIKPGDTHILGDIKDYKWMPEKLWLDADVKIIFADYVAYFMSWQNTMRAILLKDKNISRMEKTIFNYVWEMSMTPTHSSVDQIYGERN